MLDSLHRRAQNAVSAPNRMNTAYCLTRLCRVGVLPHFPVRNGRSSPSGQRTSSSWLLSRSRLSRIGAGDFSDSVWTRTATLSLPKNVVRL